MTSQQRYIQLERPHKKYYRLQRYSTGMRTCCTSASTCSCNDTVRIRSPCAVKVCCRRPLAGTWNRMENRIRLKSNRHKTYSCMHSCPTGCPDRPLVHDRVSRPLTGPRRTHLRTLPPVFLHHTKWSRSTLRWHMQCKQERPLVSTSHLDAPWHLLSTDQTKPPVAHPRGPLPFLLVLAAHQAWTPRFRPL